MKAKTVKYIAVLLFGVMFLAATVWAYGGFEKIFEMREFELTFVSNTLVGLLFLMGGIIYLTKKRELPAILYLSGVVMLMLVFLTCMAFITTMNFRGGFIFLHIIDPIAALLTYLFLIEQKKLKHKVYMLGIVIFLILYLVYAIIYGFSSGYWLYGFINVPKKGALYVGVFTLISAVVVFALEFGLYYLNKVIHKTLLKQKSN